MQVQRQFIDISSTKVLVELPESCVNHRVELIILTVDEERAPLKKRRRPHPEIAGKGTTIGDLVQPFAHERDQYESVWDAIEDTPVDAVNIKLRSSLMIAIRDHLEQNEVTQAEAAKLLGVTQPRVSDLMRGKINLFNLDSLVNMATVAGMHVEIKLLEAA